MKNNKIASLGVILSALVLLTACDKRDKNFIRPSTLTDNVIEVAQKNNYNVFAAAVKAAGMDSAFEYLGQYTMFVPNDAAFGALGINAGNVGTALPAATLRSVLRNHILAGRSPAANLLLGPNALYGNINRDNLYCTIYVPEVAGAFAGTYFNGARVVKTDMIANNGLLHEINRVLLPPAGNLTQTLMANANLSFLNAAINRAGLAGTLNGSTANFNLLAPTNAAFQAAGFATIAAIEAADPAALTPILAAHVIPASTVAATSAGRLFSVDFRARTYNTLLGAPITVTLNGTAPRFAGAGNGTNTAGVTAADILFRTNVAGGAPSVMHVIDRVILP